VNRVSPGLILVAFFGLLTMLGVWYGIKQSQRRESVAKPAKPLQKVLLAAMDLPEGRSIRNSDFVQVSFTDEQLAKRKWPMFLMVDGKQLINRVLNKPLRRGEPFDPDCFYPEGTGPDISERLRPGYRAFPVEVPVPGLPARMVPGNWVEVIFRTEPKKDSEYPELTRTLIDAVEVLAIGDVSTVGALTSIQKKEDKVVVMLAVTGEQAEKIKVVEGHGSLSLSLCAAPVSAESDVPPSSELGRPTSNLTLASVLGLPDPPMPEEAAKPAPPMKSEIFRRGRRQVVTFSSDQNSDPATAAPGSTDPNVDVPPPAQPTLPMSRSDKSSTTAPQDRGLNDPGNPTLSQR
jgi:Flp pilus assembly protein CpaB